MKIHFLLFVLLALSTPTFCQTHVNGHLSLSEIISFQRMEISKAKDSLTNHKGFIYIGESAYETGKKYTFAIDYSENTKTASIWATFYVTSTEYAFYYQLIGKEREILYKTLTDRIKTSGTFIENYNSGAGARVSKYSYRGKTVSFGNSLTEKGDAQYFIEVKD